MCARLSDRESGDPEPRRTTIYTSRSRDARGDQCPRTQKRGGPRGNIPRGPPLRRSAVHRSAAPCSPTGFPRSTIGAGRLSFRVRNGTGRAPAARTADRWAALRPGGARVPLRAAQRVSGASAVRRGRSEVLRRARAISTPRLSASPRLHLGPINQVVYLGPYRKEN